MRLFAAFAKRLLCGSLVIGLAACSSEEDVVETPVRAIKFHVLSDIAGGEQRRLAGVVKAGTRSNVAFEISGRVELMAKKVGERVTKDDLLARLDAKPYELAVQQAEFTLSQAKASLVDAKSKFDQQAKLWERGFATRTAYDTATTNLRNAEGQVGISQSQLDLRRRDLRKTSLVAPFDGAVAQRRVEVFEEVSPGAPIYVLQTSGENEVEVSVSESLVQRIELGQKVTVSFPPLCCDEDGRSPEVFAVVSEISPQAGDGNAFPITLQLEWSPDGLRPGMSAEVLLTFDGVATDRGFSVPLGALKPRQPTAEETARVATAVIYVFDPAKGELRETPVLVLDVRGNRPQIVGSKGPNALKAGDIIASAGVGHMHDGMKVRLLDPKSLF